MLSLSKISRAFAAALLACGLAAPMALADEGVLDARIVLGESGQAITIPGVAADVHSLRLNLEVSPQAGEGGQGAALKDITFTPAVSGAKVDDVSISGNNVQVVLSAGTDNLFEGASGAVDLGTLSVASDTPGAEAAVRVTGFQTLDANYSSVSDYDLASSQAVYKVDSVGNSGNDGNGDGTGGNGSGNNNGNGSGNGDGSNNGSGGSTYQTGYSPNGNSSLSQTGDVVMYSMVGLAGVAVLAGALLLMRARKQRSKEEGR